MTESGVRQDIAVEVKDLVKTYKSSFKRQTFKAVDNVSIKIASGEVYGLIGPNGSGKSTTMKAVLGLISPTSGSCSVFGADSTRVDARSEIGFLPENPYFYRHQTSAETLKFYGQLCGIRGKKLTNKVDELLELVSLDHARNRRLAGYSKGMLQRVGLAQALIQEPQLLILDEPTAGVDPIGSREIRDLILKLKSQGVTIFLCSHLLEQVQEVCDRVGIIFEGKMVNEGTLEELTEIKNQHEFIIKNAQPELVESIEKLIAHHPQTEMVRSGKPRSSLEKLFIETANMQKQNKGETQS